MRVVNFAPFGGVWSEAIMHSRRPRGCLSFAQHGIESGHTTRVSAVSVLAPSVVFAGRDDSG